MLKKIAPSKRSLSRGTLGLFACVAFVVTLLGGHVRPNILTQFGGKSGEYPLLVTSMDYGYRFLGSNFLCNLRRLNLDQNTLIVAVDQQIEEFLSRYFPEFETIQLDQFEHLQSRTDEQLKEHQKPSSDVQRFGSEEFEAVARSKIDAALGVMSLYPKQDIVFSDPDITWCNNAIEPLLRVVQEAKQSPTEIPDMYFGPDPPNGYLNSGFFFARNTRKLREFLLDFKDKGKGDDQTTYKRILCDNHKVEGGCLNEQNIRVQFIDNNVFSNGKPAYGATTLLDFRRETIQSECNPSTRRATIHWNYMSGSQKAMRMKRAGMWYVNETTLDSDDIGLGSPGDSVDICQLTPA